MRNCVLTLVLASLVGTSAEAATGPAKDRGAVVRVIQAQAAPQDPRPAAADYERRDAASKDLEEFSGGAIGLIAAVLVVLLLVLLL